MDGAKARGLGQPGPGSHHLHNKARKVHALRAFPFVSALAPANACPPWFSVVGFFVSAVCPRGLKVTRCKRICVAPRAYTPVCLGSNPSPATIPPG